MLNSVHCQLYEKLTFDIDENFRADLINMFNYEIVYLLSQRKPGNQLLRHSVVRVSIYAYIYDIYY